MNYDIDAMCSNILLYIYMRTYAYEIYQILKNKIFAQFYIKYIKFTFKLI
jgi:hypothetical protein